MENFNNLVNKKYPTGHQRAQLLMVTRATEQLTGEKAWAKWLEAKSVVKNKLTPTFYEVFRNSSGLNTDDVLKETLRRVYVIYKIEHIRDSRAAAKRTKAAKVAKKRKADELAGLEVFSRLNQRRRTPARLSCLRRSASCLRVGNLSSGNAFWRWDLPPRNKASRL
jgi:hypothetical protein